MDKFTKYVPPRPQINWHGQASPDDQLLAANLPQFVLNPWGMIDYHLYLASVERNRYCETRLNKTHLLTADGLEQVSYDELWDISTFDRVPRGTHPMIMFAMLPVPTASGERPNRKLVLGFDLKNHHLLAYLFGDAPDSISDLEMVWEQGQPVIDLDVDRFLEILAYTMDDHLEILRVGMLGYFQESAREFQSALELVVVVLFVQFLNDFADLLDVDSDEFLAIMQPYEEELRGLICKASYDAWFAASNGESIQEYRQRRMDDYVLFDLVQDPAPRIATASGVRTLDLDLKWYVADPVSPSRLLLAMLVIGICVSIASHIIRFQRWVEFGILY